MNELALFSGAGGGILGGKLLGWKCRLAVEHNAFCARRLMQRQNEGHLPPFPIWDDVCTFDGRPWAGHFDVVSGGFPCTDISVAGAGAGIDGEESGLWREMHRIIGEVRPRFVLVENSPALAFRGGLRVVGDLASLGYDMRWGIMGAEDAIWSAGPPVFDHERKRIWVLAFTDAPGFGREQAGPWQSSVADNQIANTHGSEWRPHAASCGRVAGSAGLPQGEESPSGPESCDTPLTDADHMGCENQPEPEPEEHARIIDGGAPLADTEGQRPNPRGLPFGIEETEPVLGIADQTPSDPESERRPEEGKLRPGESSERPPSRNQEVTDTDGNGCDQMEYENDGGTTGAGQFGSPAESTGGWWSAEPDVDRVVYGLANRVDRLTAVGNAQVPLVVALAVKILASNL